MPRNVKYRQCVMRRLCAGGSMRTTSYIPHEFAIVGCTLRLREDVVGWVNGWVVESVGERIVDSDRVPDSHKAIRGHRRSTGDSNE
jgi:hypothetical protein